MWNNPAENVQNILIHFSHSPTREDQTNEQNLENTEEQKFPTPEPKQEETPTPEPRQEKSPSPAGQEEQRPSSKLSKGSPEKSRSRVNSAKSEAPSCGDPETGTLTPTSEPPESEVSIIISILRVCLDGTR